MSENQNIEWKVSWRDEYLKWICGFANAKGGRLYIGKNDKGDIEGIKNHKKLLEDLPNKMKDTMGVFAEVNLYSEDSKYYIEIVVPKYDVPISLRGKYYLRYGSTLQELRGITLNEFILKRTGKTWDDILEERATIQDIDLDSIEYFLKDARTSNRIDIEPDIDIEVLLDKLRLRENGLLKRAAIILFGKEPSRFYSNLAIKIGKFGDAGDDIIFHEVLEGNLIQLQKKIVELLHAKFFIHPIKFEGMQRIEQDEYPKSAVREMIFNALVHRNYMGAPTQIRSYKGSFSIWNHGGLPEGIRVVDLWKTHRSIPRNPLIADVCFKGGYIDIWGSGTLRIINACKDAGLPQPKLEEQQGGFISEMYNAGFNKLGTSVMGEIRNKYGVVAEHIVSLIGEDSNITTSQISKLVEKSISTIERELRKLRSDGLIDRKGSDKTGYWIVHISDEGVNEGVNE